MELIPFAYANLPAAFILASQKETSTLDNGEKQAIDTMVYRTSEIERITELAIKAAELRDGKICSVDKANVLETSVLWRKTVINCVQKHNPDIELTHMYVDNAAMQLVRDPNQFDVLVTENMFGDISLMNLQLFAARLECLHPHLWARKK